VSNFLRYANARLRNRHLRRLLHASRRSTGLPSLDRVTVSFVYVTETVQLRSCAPHCAKQTFAPCVLLLAWYEIEASSWRTVGHHNVDVVWNIIFPKVVLGAWVAECPLSAFRLVRGGEDREGRAVLESERMGAFGQVHYASFFRQRPSHDGDCLIVLLGLIVLVQMGAPVFSIEGDVVVAGDH